MPERWLKQFPKYARSDFIDAFAMLSARRVANDSYLKLRRAGGEVDSWGLTAELVA